MPFRFVLGSDEVIAAWNDGLVGMCEGERRRLMVPWAMGYGAKGGKGVPPYSDLQVRRAMRAWSGGRFDGAHPALRPTAADSM
jgi:FKBP-type peptidyl-prolyl cis-trans isomerase 2